MSKALLSKTGAPPGTIIYSGKERTEVVKISLLEYNEKELIEKTFGSIDECLANLNPGMVKWINVDGIHQVETVEKIGILFNIHPLTLEDIVNTEQRSKFEDYDSYVVAIMKMLSYERHLQSEQLSIILMENTVISFQEADGNDVFDFVRNRLRQGKGRIRKYKADYLAYSLIDAVVDSYFTILEKIGDKIEALEEQLINNPSTKTLTYIHEMKREMIYLRKAAWPLRELISNMERTESKLIKKGTGIYLRDVHDHAIRVIDTLETYRDLLSGMMDIYLSSVSNRMNDVMKTLTIISTIFIPVTFIAGVYGMNFDYMPELHSPMGYIAVWIVMLAVMITMVIYFKRKKWF